MQELSEKFKNLANFRSNALTAKFGENLAEAFNYPENRFWYADHIYPIDLEMVDVGNKILKELNLPQNLKTIADVFNNKTLESIYNGTFNQEQTTEK